MFATAFQSRVDCSWKSTVNLRHCSIHLPASEGVERYTACSLELLSSRLPTPTLSGQLSHHCHHIWCLQRAVQFCTVIHRPTSSVSKSKKRFRVRVKHGYRNLKWGCALSYRWLLNILPSHEKCYVGVCIGVKVLKHTQAALSFVQINNLIYFTRLLALSSAGLPSRIEEVQLTPEFGSEWAGLRQTRSQRYSFVYSFQRGIIGPITAKGGIA